MRQVDIQRRQPLGLDREHRRFWVFQHDPAFLYVEAAEQGCWGYYSTPSEVDQLLSHLNAKGKRERMLVRALKALRGPLVSAMNVRLAQIRRYVPHLCCVHLASLGRGSRGRVCLARCPYSMCLSACSVPRCAHIGGLTRACRLHALGRAGVKRAGTAPD